MIASEVLVTRATVPYCACWLQLRLFWLQPCCWLTFQKLCGSQLLRQCWRFPPQYHLTNSWRWLGDFRTIHWSINQQQQPFWGLNNARLFCGMQEKQKLPHPPLPLAFLTSSTLQSNHYGKCIHLASVGAVDFIQPATMLLYLLPSAVGHHEMLGKAQSSQEKTWHRSRHHHLEQGTRNSSFFRNCTGCQSRFTEEETAAFPSEPHSQLGPQSQVCCSLITLGPCTIVGHVTALPWVRFRVWVRVGSGLDSRKG